jgi:hypothetical protein
VRSPLVSRCVPIEVLVSNLALIISPGRRIRCRAGMVLLDFGPFNSLVLLLSADTLLLNSPPSFVIPPLRFRRLLHAIRFGMTARLLANAVCRSVRNTVF